MSSRGSAAAVEVAEVTPIKTARDPFDFPLAEGEVAYKGVTYKFRELTVAENDQCREAATDTTKKPPEYDGRVHMRMMICMGSVDPIISPDQLEKFPQRLYGKILEVVTDLNDEGTLDAETEGNA